MDSQIEKAIEIAWDISSDQTLKSQAFEFINQLRSEPQGWQVCLALFTRSPRASEVVRLVSLEVVNNAVHSQQLDAQSLLFLKQSLLHYIRQTYAGTGQEQADAPHIQNKLTQTLTYLFAHLYKEGWETFFHDFLALTSLPNSSGRENLPGVIMYLRMLSSIHDEVADQLIARQGHEAKRNADLKDLIRQRDMINVAASWQDILAQYRDQNDIVLEMTLKIMGKWVGWTDISLVMSQEMLNLLLPLVGRSGKAGGEDKVRNTAIETLNEIVGKKMPGPDKMEMISFLNLGDIISQLLASAPLQKFKGTPCYDTDLAEAVAKLVNTVLADVVRVLEDSKVDTNGRAKGEQLLREFLPFLLRLFSDEYDEVCSTVIPSLTDLLTFLRRVPNLPSTCTAMLSPILEAIVRKSRYDETTSWGSEDEQTDEAEFQELRKRLQILQKSVAAVDQNLYIEYLSNLVASVFSTFDRQGSQMDWRDLDLALHEIQLFGDLAIPNAGLVAKSQPNGVAAERLAAVMSKMVESDIASFPHPAIVLQYMEICVRYHVFFEMHRHYIARVLESFVRLVHHNHVRVRTRSWYLFLRFVKVLRGQLGNVAQTVIQSLADLLPIKAEVPGNDADDDMASDETDVSADAVFNSQLYLYEAIGCVASTGATPAEEQALYSRSVMEPLFSDMSQNLQRAKAGDMQATLQIHHIVTALGTLAHGFTENVGNVGSSRPVPPKVVSHQFSRAAEVILLALNELNASGEIRASCRTAFSRLLAVLGNAVLPQLPQWIEGLLSRSSSKDEMAMFLRLLQQVVFNFKGEIHNVLDILLGPLLERVLGGLSEPINGTDDEIQLQELQREYLSFLQVILIHDLGSVLVSTTNQTHFESLISSILTLATTVAHGHLAASRIAFAVLQRMAAQWGGADIATIAQNPTAPSASPSPTFPGFDQFMIDRFHTACWDVMQNPSFKPFNDAQSRSVLSEMAGLEQTIYTKTGDAYITTVQTRTLPQLGIESNEYLRALTTSTERKAFTQYLATLLKSRR